MRYFIQAVLFSFICVCFHTSTTAQNQEMKSIFLADQKDRQNLSGLDESKRKEIYKRDRDRIDLVTQILKNGGLKTAEDYVYASLIFHHGHNSEEYRTAFALVQIACLLKPESVQCHSRRATSWDRLMLSFGQPQWYGTQYDYSETGDIVLAPINPSIISDEDRKKADLPPVDIIKINLENTNKKNKLTQKP